MKTGLYKYGVFKDNITISQSCADRNTHSKCSSSLNDCKCPCHESDSSGQYTIYYHHLSHDKKTGNYKEPNAR